MQELFSAISTIEFLFLIGLVGAFVTFPLQDVLSVGFYDSTDFFLGMVATSVIAHAVKNKIEITNGFLWMLFIGVAVVLILLKIFVILPFMSRAESSTVQTAKELEGMQAEVITPIPENSTGEILISTGLSKINKMAKIYSNGEHSFSMIEQGEKVLVIEILDNVAYVVPYESSFKQTIKKVQ